MNVKSGAHDLIATLLGSGVDVCFANPGTSEMHFVAALDDHPDMRSILCLFEGGVTGAADGYGRMLRQPAATLLHLGPGLANGLAGLHNAKKAHTPMVNVIGDHATFHKQYDAPLNSDVEATARPYAHVIRSSVDNEHLAADAALAVAAAHENGGQISCLVLPADLAWNPGQGGAARAPCRRPDVIDATALETTAAALQSGKKVGLILGGDACFGAGLRMAGQIAARTGVALLVPHATGRIERGRGLPPIDRIPFPVPAAVAMLRDFDTLILIGAAEPVAFFAYPGLPSRVVDPRTRLVTMATPEQDVLDALNRLCDATGAGDTAPDAVSADRLELPVGPLNTDTLATVIARHICDDMILVDEGVTSSRGVFDTSRGAGRHDLLVNVGGAIGAGMPLALGAAVACPDRPVLCITGDGSASYTVQTLWSLAQQKSNVTIIVCANHTYEILRGEMLRVGAMPQDDRANRLLDIEDPRIDWVSLAKGYGVPGRRVESVGELDAALAAALASADGPRLIEVPLAPGVAG